MKYVYRVTESENTLFSSFEKAEQRIKDIAKNKDMKIVRVEHLTWSHFYSLRNYEKQIGRVFEIIKTMVY